MFGPVNSFTNTILGFQAFKNTFQQSFIKQEYKRGGGLPSLQEYPDFEKNSLDCVKGTLTDI